ncbi:hypothetical protein K7X08_018094 [Anisodus acutangulus]|uniref:Uncharacterized protein n=1 Tax=Anisodus acutangulus TaxID=402998 RepID=A0A9Q1LV04_9SOLA|nr:hypothetical protein K7X08_018094 [Anisodus acutangulus]
MKFSGHSQNLPHCFLAVFGVKKRFIFGDYGQLGGSTLISFYGLDELVILDYMANRGFHQMGEVFAREVIVNPNPVAINASEGCLLEWWNISYEILSSRFPEVAQTVNIVPNINPENLTYALNHMGANISNAMASSPVMPSPHLLSSLVPVTCCRIYLLQQT